VSLYRRFDMAGKFQVSGSSLSPGNVISLRTSHLMERAIIAAKQMRYFQLFT
jgi:hypothetical protein